MDDVIVFPSDLAHVRFGGKTGLCMAGCRAWAARHGIDWAAFVRSGVPASALLATNDACAAEAVEIARFRVQNTEDSGQEHPLSSAPCPLTSPLPLAGEGPGERVRSSNFQTEHDNGR